ASLAARIKVTVSASGTVAVPTSNLVNGAVYDKSQTLELTSADGADIYYTTDGTEPTTASKKYDGAITLAADSKTDKVYTIKAIAVSASLNTSAVSEFKFTVLAPTYNVTIKSGENTAGLGGGKYHEGDVVTVQTASMAKGYVFDGWTAEGIELDSVQKTSPSFTFTMPKSNVALTPSYLYTITNIALAIDKPTKNNNLDTSAGYTLTGYDNSNQISTTEPLTVVWTPADTQAKGNTEYTAIAVLKPNYANGFVFDDSVTATVDGASSTTCRKSDDGSVTVYAVFPSTDKVKLTSIIAPDAMHLNDLTYSYNELMSILPKSVDIATDDGKTRTAGVSWDISPMGNWLFFFNYGFGSSDSKQQLTGSVTLPDEVDANGITLTTTITLNKHDISDSAKIPTPDITPGAYSENQELNFNKVSDYLKEIRYTTDGSEPSESHGNIYTSDAPIALNGTAGERKTITVKVMAVGSNGYNNSAVQAYKYTIELPAEKETVTVINGIGSGKYNNGDEISIIAQPENGKVFTGWIAEAVTYTTTETEVTETILDENGDPKNVTTTKTDTTRNARTIDGCFADASKPVTAFTVPNVNSGEIIEVTAQCADAVTAVNLKAAIPSCGELMPTTMTTGAAGVTVNNFAVTPSDTKAKADTQYTMTATLTPQNGYVFGENPTFTVNGTTAAGTPNGDGTYTVLYTFRTEIPTKNIELDMTNGKAYITADKEYTNPVVLFAAYNDDELVCVSFTYKDLDAGINEINIPADFSADNANTVKVMVWNNLDDIVQLFEAYVKIKS
ncbi:MAG: FN3 associated domain-containing protein, partial [Monoglobaceae bacterium]